MKKILLLLALLLPFGCLLAQEGIKGSVFDEKNKPKEGVKVWINGDRANAVRSTNTGRFTLAQPINTEIKKLDIEFKTYVVKNFVYDGKNLNIYIQDSDNHLKGEILEAGKALANAEVIYKDSKTEKHATTDKNGVFMMHFELENTISATAEILVNGKKIPNQQLQFFDDNHLLKIRMDKENEIVYKKIFLKNQTNQALKNFSFSIDGKNVKTDQNATFLSPQALSDKNNFASPQAEITEKIFDDKKQMIILTLKVEENPVPNSEQKTEPIAQKQDKNENKNLQIGKDDLSKGFQQLSSILNEEKEKLAEGREFLRHKLVEMTEKIISDQNMSPERRALLQVEYETIEDMLFQNDQAYKEASQRTSEVMQKMKLAISERDSLNELTKKQLQVIEEEKAQIEQSRFYISIFAIFTFILLVIGFFVARRIRSQKRQLEIQSKELQQAYQQIKDANQELEKQNLIIQSKNANITASINYAQRIQRSMLPQESQFRELLPQSFVFFKPRDIVSGDFYWLASQQNQKIIVAAIDCTGHGVPGAFMSMLGDALMNQIIKIQKIYSPDQILNEMHEGVSTTLRQEQTSNRDGMDMAIVVWDKAQKQIEFAGAKNPLIYIQNGEIKEVKGTPMPIGGRGKLQKEKGMSFQKSIIPIDTPTHCYIFSDGYEDQFGGVEGRKFMKRKFIDLLQNIHTKDFQQQLNLLDQEMQTWKGNRHQVDDMLVIGFRVE